MKTSNENDYLQFIIDENILCFGQYTLKSGRLSPYFYNSGLFNSGNKLAKLGRFYAQAIANSGIKVDMLFGPAYKGIPLVCATSIALAQNHGIDLPYAFNRKEAKDHGEGGQMVGAVLTGKVMIIDDVISAGLTIGESVSLVRSLGADPVAVAIGFDRQEVGPDGSMSAVSQVKNDYGIKVLSISSVNSLSKFLEAKSDYAKVLQDINSYREKYGAD